MQAKWSADEVMAETGKDWAKDIERHNSGNNVLSQQQFSDSLFELVDEWCGLVSMKMYSSFLNMVYENIRAVWKTIPDPKTTNGKVLYKLKPIETTNNLQEQLAALNREGRKFKDQETNAMNKEFNANQKKDNVKLADGRQCSKTSFMMTSSDVDQNQVNKRERTIAKAQLRVLTEAYSASFDSEEEVIHSPLPSTIRPSGSGQLTSPPS